MGCGGAWRGVDRCGLMWCQVKAAVQWSEVRCEAFYAKSVVKNDRKLFTLYSYFESWFFFRRSSMEFFLISDI